MPIKISLNCKKKPIKKLKVKFLSFKGANLEHPSPTRNKCHCSYNSAFRHDPYVLLHDPYAILHEMSIQWQASRNGKKTCPKILAPNLYEGTSIKGIYLPKCGWKDPSMKHENKKIKPRLG